MSDRARDWSELTERRSSVPGEPVVAHGPFVMNTRQEIVDAIRDYEAGLFDNVSAA